MYEEILICHQAVSQENKNRFFFFHFWIVCLNTGNKEVRKQARTVNQTDSLSVCFNTQVSLLNLDQTADIIINFDPY